jgi:hypothetical protein
MRPNRNAICGPLVRRKRRSRPANCRLGRKAPDVSRKAAQLIRARRRSPPWTQLATPCRSRSDAGSIVRPRSSSFSVPPRRSV